MLHRQMLYCNDKVKRTASVKPTNKLNLNKYILTSLSKVKTEKKTIALTLS